jgi:hypothetical protein
MEGESLDDLISRFNDLLTELDVYEVRYSIDDLVEKFLDALPSSYDMLELHLKSQ